MGAAPQDPYDMYWQHNQEKWDGGGKPFSDLPRMAWHAVTRNPVAPFGIGIYFQSKDRLEDAEQAKRAYDRAREHTDASIPDAGFQAVAVVAGDKIGALRYAQAGTGWSLQRLEEVEAGRLRWHQARLSGSERSDELLYGTLQAAGTVAILHQVATSPWQYAAPASGETAATRFGRQMHKEYEWGPGWEKEVKLPSGRKVDAANFERFEVGELKPDNPRAIRRGYQQLEGYRQELERITMHPWKVDLRTYSSRPPAVVPSPSGGLFPVLVGSGPDR